MDSDDDDINNLQNKIEDYSSDDSEDEKKPKAKMPKVVDLSSNDNKTLPKDFGKADVEERDIKIQNIISFNQRKRQAMLKEMIHKTQK